MRIWKLSLKRFTKAAKKQYKESLKRDLDDFNSRLNDMRKYGYCIRECTFCPMRIASDLGIKTKSCGTITHSEMREVCQMNAK